MDDTMSSCQTALHFVLLIILNNLFEVFAKYSPTGFFCLFDLCYFNAKGRSW